MSAGMCVETHVTIVEQKVLQSGCVPEIVQIGMVREASEEEVTLELGLGGWLCLSEWVEKSWKSCLKGHCFSGGLLEHV